MDRPHVRLKSVKTPSCKCLVVNTVLWIATRKEVRRKTFAKGVFPSDADVNTKAGSFSSTVS